MQSGQIKCSLFLGLVVFSLGFAGCSKDAGTRVDQGTQAQVLHYGNGTEPQDLDPHIVTGVPEHNILAALFEGLVGENPKDLSPVPGMAESWEISNDLKQYTFKIRKDAKWSNGESFTAKDFVYSWKRILSPKLASEYAYMLYVVKNAEAFNKGKLKDFSKVGVKALDNHTLQVQLKGSTPYFLHLLQHYSTWPVHQATIEKFGTLDTRGSKWTRPGNLVGNGPFKLTNWELNKIVSVEKSPTYWDAAKVRLNGIHFYPTESQQTEERAFRAGQLHVTNEVPINKIAVYKKERPQDIQIHPYLGTYYYMINTTKKPFDNKLVRRALALSVDRKLIVERVTKGGQIPAFSFTPPNTAGYTARAKTEYNIEKAKELLAQAGYPNGKGLPDVEILYNTNESHKVIAEAVQQMWKKNLGVNAVLTNQEWKVYLNTRRNLSYGAVARAGWIGDYPDPNNFLDMFITDSGNNDTGWSNKKYDQLIAQAAVTADRDERLETFQKAESILMEELPVIPIYTYTRVYLKSPDVKGWYPNILDHHPYKHVYLERSKEIQLSQN